MQALSIRQPWASLIAFGEKTIECRTWSTGYRGPLLIHASGRDVEGIPAGYAIATVDLVDVRPLTPADMEAACLDTMPEGLFFAWVLRGAQEIEPVPCKGHLHLWDADIAPVPLEGEDWTHIDAIMRLRGVA